MRTAAVLGALSVVMMSGGLVLMTGGSAQASVTNTDNVTICHDPQGNGNTGNGYTIETVDPFSIIKDSGHDGHAGDIIPTFSYDFDQGSKHYEGTYPGKNTDKASWIGNDCAPRTESQVCPEGSTRAGQPLGDQPCSKPAKVVVTDSEGSPDCGERTVEMFTTTTRTTYRFENGAWVANEPTVDTQSQGFRDATQAECPTQVTTCPPGTARADQPVGGQPCDKGPDVVKTTSEGAPDCETGKVEQFETTTTTTYSFAEGAWHANAPTAVKVSKGFRDATAGECESNIQPTLTLVTPDAPSQTEPTCTAAGSITAPAAQTGVVVTSADLGNGAKRFDSVPATGYTFGAGNAQSVSHTVTAKPKKSGADCAEVEGTDDSTGEPSTPPAEEPQVEGTNASRTPPVVRAPVLKGTSAAVPNAVDAGLAGAPLTDVRVLVGQALLGGGLLLLAGAAWSGLGLQRRGDLQA